MKKKILYVHHSVANGGAPKSLAYLINKLDKNKYEPIVLCFCDQGNLELFNSVGAKVIIDFRMRPFHGSTVSGMNPRLFLSGLYYALPTYFVAKRHIREIKPDLIHLNSMCLFMVAKAAKSVSKQLKVITHIREPILDSIFGKILKIMNQKYIDGYVAIDKYDAQKAGLRNKKNKIIYNFVDFGLYNSQKISRCLYSECHIPYHSVILIYLARIAKSNGVEEMIDAFTHSKLDKNKYFLVIVGDQPDNNEAYSVKIRQKCKNFNNIHLIPFRKDVPEVLASSDILICPFIQPHFSRAIIEAGAMQIPSIASDIGGPNELVIPNETGYLFNPSDFNEMIKYIELLGESPNLRKKMGIAAEEYAKKIFNADINAQQTFEFYEDIWDE